MCKIHSSKRNEINFILIGILGNHLNLISTNYNFIKSKEAPTNYLAYYFCKICKKL